MLRPRRIQQPFLAITRHSYEGEALVQAIELLPHTQLFRPGDTIVIVPNLVKNLPPATGTISGPGTLARLLQYLRDFQPARLVVAAGSGGDPTPQVLAQQGFQEVISAAGAQFVDLNYGPYIELELEQALLPRLLVNRLLAEADVIISLAQIKVHQEATVTLGIKNIALSWPPAELHGFPKTRLGIHEDLHGFIAAMAAAIPIDLTLLSADQGMVGTGPSGGKPVNADLVLAGTDPVATDCAGARLLGFLPQAVRYLWQLGRKGIGVMDLRQVLWRGLALAEAERIFSQAAYGCEIAIDAAAIKPPHVR